MSRPKTQGINTAWFKQRLADRGLSQRELSTRMRMDKASVSLMLNGKRGIKIGEAESLAHVLNAPIEDVLVAAGIKVPRAGGGGSRTIPIAGWIDGDGAAEIDWTASDDRTPAPSDVPPGAVAIQVRAPQTVRDGEMIITTPPSGVNPDCIGRLCLIATKSGATHLRYVRRGYKAGSYNLLTDGGAVTENAALEWASPVLWIKLA